MSAFKKKILIYCLNILGVLMLVLSFFIKPFPELENIFNGLQYAPLFLLGLVFLSINFLPAKIKSKARIYALNFLGILMLLLIPIIGPLPGPGGIPLLIGGLKLLSINNPWANSLMKFIERECSNLSDLIFLENKKVQLAFDIFVVLGLAFQLYTFIKFEDFGSIWIFEIKDVIHSIVFGILLFIALRNRHRWRRFSKYFKLKILKKKNN